MTRNKERPRWRSRTVKSRILFYGGVLLLIAVVGATMMWMPGRGYRGALPIESPEVRALATALQAHVVMLSKTIGERSVNRGDSMQRAQRYLADTARPIAALTHSTIQLEDVGNDGGHANNIFWDVPGASPELVVVGAHYDSAEGAPGADDNASGVAATLELARRLASQHLTKTVRFVLFANEEPPYFKNPGMGSLVHARGCLHRGERITAMLCLESLAYYSDDAYSQKDPPLIGSAYPNQGNFVAFVGNMGSRSLVHRAISAFRLSTQFPSEGAALPAKVPGVDWSDHWSFGQFGYPAIMVTDTAVFRNPNYHRSTDTYETLDYARLARVTVGLEQVVRDLAGRN